MPSATPPRLACAALFALLTPCGVAQTVYRCGSTYSQTPCSDQAQPVRAYAAPSPRAEPGPRGFALCAAQLPAADAARARPDGTRRAEVIRYAGQSLAAQRHDLVVDARDAGLSPTAYRCWLSEDQARVLLFEPRP